MNSESDLEISFKLTLAARIIRAQTAFNFQAQQSLEFLSSRKPHSSVCIIPREKRAAVNVKKELEIYGFDPVQLRAKEV